MDYDDFEELMRDRSRERFNAFKDALDAELKKRGDDRTFDELFRGKEPKVPVTQASSAVAYEIAEATGESVENVMRRALGLLRSAVKHVRAGGKVVFRDEDGTERVLKVRTK